MDGWDIANRRRSSACHRLGEEAEIAGGKGTSSPRKLQRRRAVAVRRVRIGIMVYRRISKANQILILGLGSYMTIGIPTVVWVEACRRCAGTQDSGIDCWV